MAGYSIVLRLSGNAVSQSERLADNLWRAQANAAKLARNLTAVGTAARTVPSAARYVGGVGAGRMSPQLEQSRVALNMARVAEVQARSARAAERAAARYAPYQRSATFATSTRYGAFGLTGRFSSLIRPDANGNILGVNAESLAKTMNITGVATAAAVSIGKALMKAVAISTIAPLAIAGGGVMLAVRALQSDSFSQGNLLNIRRIQARKGLGPEFEAANAAADSLAAAYGLERSTALSSVNVLTGLGVGGTGLRLNMGQAANLTKIGGLISQGAGVPFERVMTNIQQLLVNQTPSLRDIRELLNQAPILGKYALREMEQRGVVGTDTRDYLKNQANLLSVLKRYELDNGTNAGMQARGRIQLAQQDAWAQIAGNDQAWQYFGGAGADMITAMYSGFNNLLTMLSENTQFQTSVIRLTLLFEQLGTTGVNALNGIIDKVYGLLSVLDLAPKDSEARMLTQKRMTVAGAYDDPAVRDRLYRDLSGSFAFQSNTEAGRREEFNAFLESQRYSVLRDPRVLDSMGVYGELSSTTDHPWWMRAYSSMLGGPTVALAQTAIPQLNPLANSVVGRNNYVQRNTVIPESSAGYFVQGVDPGNMRRPTAAALGMGVQTRALAMALRGAMNSGYESGDFSGLTGGSTFEPPTASDLTGFNNDRRALTINFNAPIVEWDSRIESTSPAEVVEEVGANIEQMAAAAIQKALLGATGKMETQFV